MLCRSFENKKATGSSRTKLFLHVIIPLPAPRYSSALAGKKSAHFVVPLTRRLPHSTGSGIPFGRRKLFACSMEIPSLLLEQQGFPSQFQSEFRDTRLPVPPSPVENGRKNPNPQPNGIPLPVPFGKSPDPDFGYREVCWLCVRTGGCVGAWSPPGATHHRWKTRKKSSSDRNHRLGVRHTCLHLRFHHPRSR